MAGLPLGLGSLFFVTCALLMPFVHLGRLLRKIDSPSGWRFVVYHVTMASSIIAAVVATMVPLRKAFDSRIGARGSALLLQVVPHFLIGLALVAGVLLTTHAARNLVTVLRTPSLRWAVARIATVGLAVAYVGALPEHETDERRPRSPVLAAAPQAPVRIPDDRAADPSDPATSEPDPAPLSTDPARPIDESAPPKGVVSPERHGVHPPARVRAVNAKLGQGQGVGPSSPAPPDTTDTAWRADAPSAPVAVVNPETGQRSVTGRGQNAASGEVPRTSVGATAGRIDQETLANAGRTRTEVPPPSNGAPGDRIDQETLANAGRTRTEVPPPSNGAPGDRIDQEALAGG